mmetsp:Transcript_30304/g.93803  ORF Transcript_30304/g.93803 Transcript_30304/m.93803 type:complete len:164 (-) Transcript_30304:46-537(-)
MSFLSRKRQSRAGARVDRVVVDPNRIHKSASVEEHAGCLEGSAEACRPQRRSGCSPGDFGAVADEQSHDLEPVQGRRLSVRVSRAYGPVQGRRILAGSPSRRATSEKQLDHLQMSRVAGAVQRRPAGSWVLRGFVNREAVVEKPPRHLEVAMLERFPNIHLSC